MISKKESLIRIKKCIGNGSIVSARRMINDCRSYEESSQMSSYEYHEFRAVDRLLTPAEQREVASLSSRAEVSARHAAYTYNYSSFRGVPEKLLTKCFDAMFYIDNSGLRLTFRLSARHFEPGRAKPYLVEGLAYEGEGVQVKKVKASVLLSIGLEELDLGWVNGEGWLEPMLPLRKALLGGDDRPLYLFWLAAFDNGLIDLDDPEVTGQPEPPVPPGMGELDEAHRVFARRFEISDGLLAAAAAQSPPRQEVGEEHLRTVVESLGEVEKVDCLLRVARGEHVEVQREIHDRARAHLSGPRSVASSRRSLEDLTQAAGRWAEDLKRRAHEARLDEIEENKKTLWQEIERRLSEGHPRFSEPVKILAQLYGLAVERAGLTAFRKRLVRLKQYGKSPAFMKRLKDAGVVDS